MEQMQVGLFLRNHYGFLFERLYYRTIIALHDFTKRKKALDKGVVRSTS
jgi:hypothetical protein